MRALIKIQLFAILILSSCVTENQRVKICRTCPNTDSVKTVIKRERYDSLIYVSSPPDTVKVPSPCDSVGNLKPFDVVSKKNGIDIEVKSVGNQIVATAHADSIPDTVKGLNTKQETTKTETKTIIVNDCPETWWQKLYRFGFWIMLPIIVLYSGYKVMAFVGWLGKKMP